MFKRTLQLLTRQGNLRALTFLHRNKEFIKRMLSVLKFPSFALRLIFFLAKSEGKSRIFLMATPEHGNLGDHAIVYAEKIYFSKFYPDMPIIEIRNSEYLNHAGFIQRRIRPTDTIIIDGGGNLGTLWPHEDDKISDIILRFKNNKIILFPQTCYYDGTALGSERLAKNREIYEEAKDMIITLRDKPSYDFMKSNFPYVKIVFIPDIVLSIVNAPKNTDGEGVLLCMRKDREKVLRSDICAALKETLKAGDIPYAVTDTVIDKRVTKMTRNLDLTEKWRQFTESGLVITDRLHGMIFAAITGTPCLALDNRSGKVKGGYEFIKHLPYIRYIDNANDIPAVFNVLYGKSGCYKFDYPFDRLGELFAE